MKHVSKWDETGLLSGNAYVLYTGYQAGLKSVNCENKKTYESFIKYDSHKTKCPSDL